MKPEILVFTIPKVTATSSLISSLRRSFDSSAYDIHNISVHDFRQHLTAAQNRPRAFILPGIIGQDSPYQHIFKKDDLEKLGQFVRNGNVFLGICAGAFFVTEITQFVPPWDNGIKHLRSLNPLFNGVANGPLHSYTLRHGLNVVPVRIDGQAKDIFLPYSMGPALFPANPKDPDLEIIATYSQMQRNSIAVLRQKIGSGSIYLSGPHPEIAHIQISKHYDGVSLFDHARAVARILEPHEPGRKEFWDHLVKRIKKDLEPCP